LQAVKHNAQVSFLIQLPLLYILIAYWLKLLWAVATSNYLYNWESVQLLCHCSYMHTCPNWKLMYEQLSVKTFIVVITIDIISKRCRYIRHLSKVIPKVIKVNGEPTVNPVCDVDHSQMAFLKPRKMLKRFTWLLWYALKAFFSI